MISLTYKTFVRARFEKKLRALSDEELDLEREKTAVLANLWSKAPKRRGPTNMHYASKLALIDEIKEDRS